MNFNFEAGHILKIPKIHCIVDFMVQTRSAKTAYCQALKAERKFCRV
jgi:hypothetical protein